MSQVRLTIWLVLGLMLSEVLVADESEKRRVDISISIFPRIVAVDNHFREKLEVGNKVRLLFVYDEDRSLAESLMARIGKDGKMIGGMKIVTQLASVRAPLPDDEVPVAIFLVERLDDAQLARVITFAEKKHRLLFSPYSGDVERGVMVGISVTNRVKPFFNLQALRRANVEINALLMKMSKRYE